LVDVEADTLGPVSEALPRGLDKADEVPDLAFGSEYGAVVAIVLRAEGCPDDRECPVFWDVPDVGAEPQREQVSRRQTDVSRDALGDAVLETGVVLVLEHLGAELELEHGDSVAGAEAVSGPGAEVPWRQLEAAAELRDDMHPGAFCARCRAIVRQDVPEGGVGLLEVLVTGLLGTPVRCID